MGILNSVVHDTLLFAVLLGGSPGLLLAMGLFRHKTRELSFQLVVGTIIVGQVTALYFVGPR